MRIPVPLAISSSLLVIATSWYFGTQNKNFTQPPSEKEKQKTFKQWNVTDTSPPSSSSNTPLKKRLNQNTLELIKPPASPLLPTGDIQKFPQLSEYKVYKNRKPQALIQLAKKLESLGAKERATLAWERILDTTQPSQEEVKQATQAISRLKKTTPPWNADPKKEIIIILHAGGTLKEKNNLESALDRTAKTITKASGNIIKIKVQVTFGKETPRNLPRVPIALWFTDSSKKSTTSPLSFLANADDTAMLTSQCQAAVYSLLSEHLQKHTSYTPLPDYPAGATSKELLQAYITRLMWREFAFSLTKK